MKLVLDGVAALDNRVMAGRRSRTSGTSQKQRKASAYTLLDPKLRAYDHGVGTLRMDGELKGYLASIVGEMRSIGPGEPWPWFVVVWADGTKESPFEDHGPKWLTVRELDAGWFEHYGQGARKTRRFFGKLFVTTTRGLTCRFDFDWLPVDEAADRWKELKLVDADF
jgi:hypothetical protein